MTYYERIRELTKHVPATLVDFGLPVTHHGHQRKHLQISLQTKSKETGLRILLQEQSMKLQKLYCCKIWQVRRLGCW